MLSLRRIEISVQLPEDELEGVIAHSLTHIANRDTLTQAVATTIAGAISFLAQIVSYSLWLATARDDNREIIYKLST